MEMEKVESANPEVSFERREKNEKKILQIILIYHR